jgi:O-antigen ligase
MPDLVTNSDTKLTPALRVGRIDLRVAAWFSGLVLLGVVATLYPEVWLACLGAAVAGGIVWFVFAFLKRQGLQVWQSIALLTMSGYMVLNYGFDNLAFHIGGFPILIAYGLMYGSLVLALYSQRQAIAQGFREPAVLFILAILGLTVLHMVSNIPSYGSWAFRDATMCFDGLFLLMGLLWARKPGSYHFIAKWLVVVFAINMFYSLTMPWSKQIWSWSPESGAYISVPLLGSYHGSGDVLFPGVLFCIVVGKYVIHRPRWLLTFLVLGQLLGLAIMQVRRVYLGIAVVIVILILAGEVKKMAKLFLLVAAALAAVFAINTWGGLDISGRVGEVNLQFFVDHLRSLSGAEDTPGSDPESRVRMAKEAFQHFRAHPIIGEGFGQPVTDEMDYDTGLVTRTPHDTTITYLARLGVVGVTFWIGFHLCLLARFTYAFRRRRFFDKKVDSFILWSFLFYVTFMMASLVESPFEYPFSAIPFYFLIGFGLGLIRWHMSLKKNSEQRSAAFAQ